MFTGLIEAVCGVKGLGRVKDGMVLTIDSELLSGGSEVGDSVAVNGCCLTISAFKGSVASFAVSKESLGRTNIGGLKAGSKVNIERALAADGRFGGHFVQGHIDGTARIKGIEKAGGFANLRFAADKELLELMVVKGSVAIDGISLTIADMDRESFSVAVIPQTLQKTTLAAAKIGDRVNVETDIIVKSVKRQLENMLGRQGKLTIERLRELGF